MRSKSPELMDKIKKYVEDFYLQHGTSPSTSKIAEGVGIVKSTAYKYLVEMAEKNMLQYDGNEIITELTQKINKDMTQTPIVGSVPCGIAPAAVRLDVLNQRLSADVIIHLLTLPTVLPSPGQSPEMTLTASSHFFDPLRSNFQPLSPCVLFLPTCQSAPQCPSPSKYRRSACPLRTVFSSAVPAREKE